jgi:hypothetical protein
MSSYQFNSAILPSNSLGGAYQNHFSGIRFQQNFPNVTQQNYKRIIYRPAQKLQLLPPPKNVLIQWDSPNVNLTRSFRNLGVQVADPNLYIQKFGNTLVDFNSPAIPFAARNVRPTNGRNLAADNKHSPVHLVGNVNALNLINKNSFY